MVQVILTDLGLRLWFVHLVALVLMISRPFRLLIMHLLSFSRFVTTSPIGNDYAVDFCLPIFYCWTMDTFLASTLTKVVNHYK